MSPSGRYTFYDRIHDSVSWWSVLGHKSVDHYYRPIVEYDQREGGGIFERLSYRSSILLDFIKPSLHKMGPPPRYFFFCSDFRSVQTFFEKVFKKKRYMDPSHLQSPVPRRLSPSHLSFVFLSST